MFLVKEMDSVPFLIGENVTFSFKLYISHFDNPPPESDQLSLIVFICAIVTFFSIIIFFLYFKSKGMSITIIHLVDLWRVDVFLQNTVLLSSAGVSFIITIEIFLFFFFTNLPKDFIRFTNIGILSNSVSAFLYGYVIFYMSREMFLPEYVAIELTFNSFTVLPCVIISVFSSYYFLSYVGIGFFKSIFVLLACLIISYLVSISFYEYSQKFFEKRLAIKPREEHQRITLLTLTPSFKDLTNFLILGIIFFVILKPALDHCFSYYIDDFYFNPFLVASFLLLYISIISLLSLFNNYRSINKFTNSWQANHFTLNMVISAIFLLYMLIDIFCVRQYLFHFETLFYCALFLICFIPGLTLIGMASSFYTSFMFFAFIYQSIDRNQSNENEQN